MNAVERQRIKIEMESASHRTIEGRREDRERLERDTQAFLRSGGRVKVLPPVPSPSRPMRRW